MHLGAFEGLSFLVRRLYLKAHHRDILAFDVVVDNQNFKQAVILHIGGYALALALFAASSQAWPRVVSSSSLFFVVID